MLKAHASVLDALVVGLPDERWGQRVAAVVEPRPGAPVAATSLEAHARQHLAGNKCPKRFFVCAKIERQPSGKPDYRWALEFVSKAVPL